jgi:hypothetical protein
MMVALAIRPPSHIVCNPYRPAALFESIDQRGHDVSPARAQRVTECDGPAVDVGLGQIRSGVLRPGQREGTA